MKKLGLALGSGAARGLVHIGILQVLEENNIKPYCVAGCSMGAVIGGIYAVGTDVYHLEEVATSIKLSKFIDFTLARGGIMSGKRVEKIISTMTSEKNFEDTLIPFGCIAVDYESGKLTNFKKGALAPAIHASLSVPGVFVPADVDGKLYIDGGVLERMPCELTRELGAEVVVGIDIEHRGQKQPKPKNTPETIQGMVNISGWNAWQQCGQKPDILIAPDVEDVDKWSAKDSKLCVLKGREAMLANLDKVKAAINY